MPLTFGSKSFDDAVTDKQQQHFEQQKEVGIIKDPLPSASSKDQQHLRTVFTDYTLWIEQFLDEMATLARKQWNLAQKIKDPALQNSPKISDARKQWTNWRDDLTNYANDIATLEASCDRLWQAMTEQTRALYEMDWSVPPCTERLLGKAFTVKARKFQWPPGYSIHVQTFRHIPPYLRKELDGVLGDETIWLGTEPDW